MTKISIIICTCNRAESLHQTLDSLSKIYLPCAMMAELIIVDNASTDNTAQVIQLYNLSNIPVHYIYEVNRGQSFARNTGLAAAQGDIIVFTDDDIRFPSDWIEKMCAPIIEGEADAVAGAVHFAPYLERQWGKPLQGWMASTETLDPAFPGRMVGANMAFSRQVLSQVPSFDVELGPGALGFADDSLFSMQLVAAGCRIVAVFDTSVEHHFQASRWCRRSLLETARKIGRSYAYLSHHWNHNIVKWPRMRLYWHLIHLVWWRMLHLSKVTAQEGAIIRELEVVQHISFFKQYLVECKRPRNYEKHGLVKLTHAYLSYGA